MRACQEKRNVKKFQKQYILHTHTTHDYYYYEGPNIFYPILTSFISFSKEYWLQYPKLISQPDRRWQLQSETTVFTVLTEIQASLLRLNLIFYQGAR